MVTDPKKGVTNTLYFFHVFVENGIRSLAGVGVGGFAICDGLQILEALSVKAHKNDVGY